MSRKAKGSVDPELLLPAVGAIIFASDEAVPPEEIAEALGGLETADVERAIAELQEHYDRQRLGLQVERVAGGYQLATRSDVGPAVRGFFRHRNRTRLTPAALETLAIIAYRQPVTSPEIQAIRGKDPSAALKSLLDKRLIKILGKKKVVGSPLLYGTRREFLEHFGLNALDDLPAIEDFDEFVDVLEGSSSLFPADVEQEDATETTAIAEEASGDPS